MNIFQGELPSTQSQRVRSILIRYCCRKEVRVGSQAAKNYLHPENSYFVKYSPKYYQSLTLEMKLQHSLLSKLKRIKKLKRFTGNFNDRIPQVNWFKILANNRKEMKEFPLIYHSQINRLFWAATLLWAAKFFFQITKLQLPPYNCWEIIYQEFFNLWESFIKQLRSLRRLKSIEIDTTRTDSILFRSCLKILNGTPWLLRRLKVLKLSLRSDASQEIFSQHKNVFLSLTHLNYIQIPSETSPINQAIPQFCKNLKSFSVVFEASRGEHLYASFHRRTKFQDFITPIQELAKIQSISINWSALCSEDFWSYFIPPASLKNLKLEFHAIDLIKVVFKADYPHKINLTLLRALDSYRDFVEYWKEIKELDTLDFQINCKEIEDMVFTRNFITAVLKKVSKLTSFVCNLSLRNLGNFRFEPFLVEEVPHLYEHLQKFEVRVSIGASTVGFDFGFLKIFKNLRSIDFQGNSCCFVNIEDVICLLEGNLSEREFSTLRFGSVVINYKEELRDLLKRISKAKKSKANLEIVIALKFYMEAGDDNEMKYLDQFCQIIESRKTVKGLKVSLEMDHRNCLKNEIDDVKRVLEMYPRIRNFVLKIYYQKNRLEYIKRDGEKVQLFSYPYLS